MLVGPLCFIKSGTYLSLIHICIALALVLVLGMAANASALTVAFSQIGQESDWRTANTDNVCAAIEAQGWELVYADAQQKQENQVQGLRSFITQGVDLSLIHI